ncbi:MAG: hypothetical protein AAF677_16935, partial [Pseudomonadota bacterium]
MPPTATSRPATVSGHRIRRLAATVSTLSPNVRGALWIMVSVLGATLMTVTVREAADQVHTVMLSFLRSALALLAVVPLLPRLRPARLRPARLP